MVGEGASVRLLLIRIFTKLVFSINKVKNYDEKLIHFRLQLFNLKPVTFEGLKSLFFWFVCISFVGITQFYVSINIRISFLKLEDKVNKRVYRIRSK